ncbi:MFS transporter [Sphingomonas sp. ASV193]|uniref:MFS transporter n=1 Tax=Sphingomonas sp. ASV193 TaxID=3144405 RepID=UPI0032E882C7
MIARSRRAPLFWLATAAIALGVLLHLPMLAEAHRMGNRLVGMPTDATMWLGMALIFLGAPLAIYGALPPRIETASLPDKHFEARADTPLGASHLAVILVLVLGLVIDVMKPATLGFVLPGVKSEYGIPKPVAALLPLVALIGTTIGSYLWGWMADRYGRRVSILLSTVLFISTSICGAMPDFRLNLLMCFVMGMSAGGMLPVVYTLLAEIMPPRHRSWVLVTVGGIGLVGGYLAASTTAHLFEDEYGWRALWLQGFPTGLLLLLLARLLPESPRFLYLQRRDAELADMECRFGIVERPAPTDDHGLVGARRETRLTVALVLAALAWSFVNFGLLLWLPNALQERGFSNAVATGIIAKSSLLALPTIGIGAWLYAKWSSKGALVAMLGLLVIGTAGAALPAATLAAPLLLGSVIGLLVLGTNGAIAMMLPYTAEIFPVASRGRGTGLVSGASKVGGAVVQLFAIAGLSPSLGPTALLLVVPLALSTALVWALGVETSGRALERKSAA